MRTAHLLLLVLALAAAGCGDGLPAESRDVEGAWDLVRAEPGADAFQKFLRANGMAASTHGDPHDARGIRYQVRALEAQAAEAVRTSDEELAFQVVDRVRELTEGGLLDDYEATWPGCRERFEAARDRAASAL